MTARLRKFAALSWTDQVLLGTTAVVLLAVRVLLPLAGLDRTRRVVSTLVGTLPPFASVSDPGRIPWAVNVADTVTPVAYSCLMRAIVAETIFAAHGYEAAVQLGVNKSTEGFNAHAWVEHRDEVVLGELDDLAEYRRLSRFHSRQ
jgi:hypothetical protein